jgi:hypothetical protein
MLFYLFVMLFVQIQRLAMAPLFRLRDNLLYMSAVMVRQPLRHACKTGRRAGWPSRSWRRSFIRRGWYQSLRCSWLSVEFSSFSPLPSSVLQIGGMISPLDFEKLYLHFKLLNWNSCKGFWQWCIANIGYRVLGAFQRSVFGTEHNVSETGSVSVLRWKGWDA